MTIERGVLRVLRLALYALVALVPLVFLQHMMHPFIILKTAVFQALASVVIFGWGALAISSPRYRPRGTPVLWALGGFFTWLLVTSFFGVDVVASMWSMASRGTGLFLFAHVVLLAVAVASLREHISWRNVLLVSGVTGSCIALGAIGSYIDSGTASFFLSPEASRPSVTFGNPTYLAGYLLLNLFALGWLYIQDTRRAARAFYAIGVAVCAVAIFLTQTRGDILGLLAGAVVFGVGVIFSRTHSIHPKRSVWRNPALWALVGACIVVVLLSSGVAKSIAQRIPGVSRFASPEMIVSGMKYRLLAWESARAAFLERPLLGWGFENFNIGFQKHYNPRLLSDAGFSETYWDKPHNVFIEYAVVAGLPGLLLFLLLLGAVAYEAKAFHDRRLRWLVWAVLIGYGVRSLVIFDTLGVLLMLAILIGFVDGNYQQTRARKEGSEGALRSALLLPGLSIAAGGVVALLVFVNIPMVRASYLEYGGPNWFLLGDIQKSYDAFDAATRVQWNVYRDATVANFAGVVKQAYEQRREYPGMSMLVPRLEQELQGIIDRHPENYFHYTYLAEFKNAFTVFDPAYLREADDLTARALTLSPQRQQVYYVRAKTALLRGDDAGAYALFEEAASLNPEAGDPYFYLALIALQRKDAERGVAALERARALGRDAQSAEEAIALGSLLGDTAERYADAARYYERALVFPLEGARKRDVEFKLAIASYYVGNADRARELFQELAPVANYRSLPFFSGLKPILDELKVSY